MRHALPYARPGQVIGLFGGSFDPAHAGHVHVSREALRRFGLDRLWWLVSPGNPLKPQGPAPLEARMQRARELVAGDPRIIVSDLEARLGTRYTADTIRALGRLYPGVRFVWIMGADNLAGFHRWQDWREIMQMVPVGVIARPGLRGAARTSKAAQVYRDARLRGRQARLLARGAAPRWVLVNVPMVAHSSSAIRARGGWQA